MTTRAAPRFLSGRSLPPRVGFTEARDPRNAFDAKTRQALLTLLGDQGRVTSLAELVAFRKAARFTQPVRAVDMVRTLAQVSRRLEDARRLLANMHEDARAQVRFYSGDNGTDRFVERESALNALANAARQAVDDARTWRSAGRPRHKTDGALRHMVAVARMHLRDWGIAKPADARVLTLCLLAAGETAASCAAYAERRRKQRQRADKRRTRKL